MDKIARLQQPTTGSKTVLQITFLEVPRNHCKTDPFLYITSLQSRISEFNKNTDSKKKISAECSLK